MKTIKLVNGFAYQFNYDDEYALCGIFDIDDDTFLCASGFCETKDCTNIVKLVPEESK